MDEKLDKAIDSLISYAFKPGGAPKCDESMKFAQAILTLCQAKQFFLEGKPKKPTS